MITSEPRRLPLLPQPTMSRAHLLLRCTWPFRNPLVPRVIANEAMKFGSAAHYGLEAGLKTISPQIPSAALAAAATKYEVDLDELTSHTTDAYRALREWLNGSNAWNAHLWPPPKKAILVEQAVCLNVVTGKARLHPGVDEHHIYQDILDHEHPGTADLVIDLAAYGRRIPPRLRDAVLVLDHKTGLTFDPPRESAQLKSLALGFARHFRRKRAVVAILHAPRSEAGGVAAVYADELSAEDLKGYLSELRRAWARLGDESLRPHAGCDWCQAVSVCPAYGGSLATLADSLEKRDPLVEVAHETLAPRPRLDLSSPESAGTVHMLLQMLRRVDDDWTRRLKVWLREGPSRVGIRPDGKITTLVETSREHLSLASLKRACGASGTLYAQWEKELRDLGAIENLAREELRAVDDR